MSVTRHPYHPSFSTPSRWITAGVLCIGNVLLASGCVVDVDSREDGLATTEGYDDAETAGSSDESSGAEQPITPPRTADAVAMAPDPASSRACVQNNGCWPGCMCSGGICIPDGWGPPAEQETCNQAPQRECVSAANCQSGCVCSGGYCQDDGVGSVNPTCYLPPKDSYENDDTWQAWKAYGGAPQWRNLHTATDNDWVAVLMPAAGNVRFRTYGLTWGTDTRMEVYAYNGVTKGALLGTNDDVGGAWWDADSKSSKVQLPVAANSAFLVRLVNQSNPSIYIDEYEWPSYWLEIAYY